MTENSGNYEPKLMAPDTRLQITITLSNQAHQDFSAVADAKGLPLATFLRNQLEVYHESPSFGALLRRYKTEVSGEA